MVKVGMFNHQISRTLGSRARMTHVRNNIAALRGSSYAPYEQDRLNLEVKHLAGMENIDSNKIAIIISADHSTPCINKGHSDDPVPVVVSADFIKNDGTTRMTEEQAKKGSIGLLQGSEVVTKSLELIRSQTEPNH